MQTDSPLEFLRAQLALHENNPDLQFDDLLSQSTMPALKLDLLPAATQFNEIAVMEEFSEFPSELMQTAQVTASDLHGGSLYTIDIPVYRLNGLPLVLDADPETTADQQIVFQYGGIETTPTYLVNLRPTLRLGQEVIAVAESGLAKGDQYRLKVRFNSPTGATETETIQTVGGLAAIAVNTGESDAVTNSSGQTAVDLMYQSARQYNAAWDRDEESLARLLRLPLVRPLPSVTIVGSSYNVSWLDNRPYAMQWEGLFVDAAIRVAEPVSSQAATSRTFMRLSGLQGSWLESATLFADYQVPAISTVDLIGLANESGIEIRTVDGSNLDASLSALPYADNVKADITDAVNQGWVVTIPNQHVSYLDWSGIGYIKEDPETGEAGFMLSGGLAGAQTATEQWADDYRNQFEFARSEPPNLDPLAAADIVFIPTGNRQNGIVGQKVAEPISIMVVDLKGRPVKGAEVTFKSLLGGGTFDSKAEITVHTDDRGIAGITPTLWYKDTH